MENAENKRGMGWRDKKDERKGKGKVVMDNGRIRNRKGWRGVEA